MSLLRVLSLGLVVALPGMASVHAAQTEGLHFPRAIEVYTDAAHPLVHSPLPPSTRLTVYEIDGVIQIKERLSEGLPGDPEEAARIATERLETQREVIGPQLNQATEGLFRARFVQGLDRYPAALLIDERGQAVIYGVIDMAEILRIYRKDRGDE